MPNPKKLLETLYGVPMQDGGNPLDRFAGKAPKRGVSSLPGYGEGIDDPTTQALLAIRRNLGEAGRAAVGVKPYDETNPTETYRAMQALFNAPTPAAIIPEAAQAAGKAAGVLSGLGALGVVKPKGGNWFAGTVERGLKPFKRTPEVLSGDLINEAAGSNLWARIVDEGGYRDPNAWLQKNRPDIYNQLLGPESASINQWIDTKLGKYIKNEMATPEDPVRALAERGVLHVDPETLNQYNPRHTAFEREMAGFPPEGMSQSPGAQRWEDISDYLTKSDTAGNLLDPSQYGKGFVDKVLETNPWLTKVDPETPVYGVDSLAYRVDYEEAGFKHLIDELRNATNPDSGLPRSLQLSPDKLQKVTVPQAVELVDKINKWRAEQKATADLKRSQNAATVEYKAYDTIPGTAEPNQRGLRWVELRAPTEGLALPKGYSIQTSGNTPYLRDEKGQVVQYLDDANGVDAAAKKVVGRMSLEDALKYEGEVMGHCVGGYCPDVESGRSRIYSLRDAKGEPHVTIEVQPYPYAPRWEVVKEYLPQAEEMMRARGITNAREEEVSELATQLAKENMPSSIQQIKGKANQAPKADYLPFVQDFVKSGQWSDVKDLKNAGLVKLGKDYLTTEEFKPILERASQYLEQSPSFEQQRRAQREYEAYRGSVFSPEFHDLQERAGVSVHPDIPYTYREMRSIFDDPSSFSEGSLGENIERVNRLRQLYGEEGLAAGGAVHMQDGGRLPPGIKRATERAKESKSVLPVAGARQARQAIQGYLGMDPSFSVMDPEAQALESAYRGGETASVLGDLFASLTPFATASALSKANQVPGLAELIAYHGSPHKFKKFDASKIGTGEGAQAYGHGLYFAENPAVAKDYRKELATEVTIDGKPYFTGGRKVSSTGDKTIDDFLTWHVGDVAKAIEAAKRMGFDEYIPKLEALKDRVKRVQGGALYTVDIPDEKIAQMLDWDKPLSQQPKAVQEAVNSIVLAEELYKGKYAPRFLDTKTTGGEAIEIFNSVLGSPQVTSNYLREAGIPGIQYLDQASRDAKQGTRNFVVFPGEEQNIKMLDINGEPQMAAGGAVSMQDGGSPLDRFMGRAPKRGVSSLPGYGQGNILQDIESVSKPVAGGIDAALTGLPIAARALVSPLISAGTFVKEVIQSGDPSDVGPLERAKQAGQEFVTGNIRPMQTELGPEYLESTAEGLERLLRESKLPPILPQTWTSSLMPGTMSAVRDVAKTGAETVRPSIMRGAQAARPFAQTLAEMIEEMAMKGVPGTDAMQLRMGILPETPKLPEAPASTAGAQSFTGRIKNDAELIAARGQAPANVERAETALNSGQRVFKFDENGNQVQVMDPAELVDVQPESLRIVNISPQELEAVNLAAKRNPEAQRSMLDQIEGLHRDFAPEDGWAPLNIVEAEVKVDKRGKPIINRQTGLPMTEVKPAKTPYAFHIPPEGMPKEAWEEVLAARLTDEVDQVLQRAKAGDQDAISILQEAAWYRAMRNRLRSEFGGIGDVFADVLGTTSAQTGVEQNFDNAIEILRRFARGDYDRELLAYDKRVRAGETVDGKVLTRMFRDNEFPLITKAGGQLFNANSPASMGALLDMFRTIKAGDAPKTPNFTGNLIGLTNEATIDVWAARMLRRLADLPRIAPPAEKGVAGLHKVGSTLYQPDVSGEFGFGQDVFRKAAQELNNAGMLKAYDPVIGDLGPDDLQAIAWFIEKELWTKNKWTTKAGEGGSLDYEMSFAGTPDSERVKSLRKDINKQFSPAKYPQRKVEGDEDYAKRLETERIAFETDKANKAEQLKNLKADVDRYRLGVSGERPNKPMSDYGQAELASEFDDVVRDDPSVVTYNLTSTLGSFMGDTERALNAEFITRSDFNPLPLERRLVEQGKYYDQDAVFMSKAVPIDAPNARPGVEIYFKQKLSPADMALVTEKLRSYGVDGFTYISDMRMENRPNLRVTTQAMQNKTFRPFAEDLRPEPGSSGITFQYIPEFDDEFDAANAAAIMQQRREIYMQIIEDMANSGNVSDARLTHFDTKVFFRGDYDDYLARATGDSYQAPRREQQSGSISEEPSTRGKNQQKLQRAVSDRVREEASSQAVKKPGGKKPLAKAAGGRVHVSNNLDTMLLELMRKKKHA